ncbi:hypothetical protein [Fructobacillus papyrifericola]|uniref:Uncharacterized protein n=1 Tax=Fructobacillus papyrifericola TaxID=2713172 RepID=A0ABS5QTX2_9LACO|nr:hypothetical protein [Fructobacillus papyrifericola]MBS9336649.1 hypothetical protein [Fructobacillus papyrifericola]
MLFKDQKVVFNDVVVPNSVGKILTDIPYGRKKWQSFDLYLPKEMQGDTLIPLLLDLQGGGALFAEGSLQKNWHQCYD